jgi:hypothetical protein
MEKDIVELAARLFAEVYDSEGGGTVPGRPQFEYMAKQAFLAAETFILSR